MKEFCATGAAVHAAQHFQSSCAHSSAAVGSEITAAAETRRGRGILQAIGRIVCKNDASKMIGSPLELSAHQVSRTQIRSLISHCWDLSDSASISLAISHLQMAQIPSPDDSLSFYCTPGEQKFPVFIYLKHSTLIIP